MSKLHKRKVQKNMAAMTAAAVPVFPLANLEQHVDALRKTCHETGLFYLRLDDAEACERCAASDQCFYSVHYTEGSAIQGHVVTDVARFSRSHLDTRGLLTPVEARVYFGCQTQETGMFFRQQADGIMGLASSRRRGEPSNPTVLEALVAARIVPDAFSLCFGAAHGVSVRQCSMRRPVMSPITYLLSCFLSVVAEPFADGRTDRMDWMD